MKVGGDFRDRRKMIDSQSLDVDVFCCVGMLGLSVIGGLSRRSICGIWEQYYGVCNIGVYPSRNIDKVEFSLHLR